MLDSFFVVGNLNDRTSSGDNAAGVIDDFCQFGGGDAHVADSNETIAEFMRDVARHDEIVLTIQCVTFLEPLLIILELVDQFLNFLRVLMGNDYQVCDFANRVDDHGYVAEVAAIKLKTFHRI